ncbi:MAG: rRNA maturation RNase YbeY [Thermoguttaceae bacterium]|nr:rRNA maturation RNase YbeY [Thermoguttaceae bacterium]MDW8036652.1 rRNA maturation RNase YbeY [Thermoguttaceae bacterium]
MISVAVVDQQSYVRLAKSKIKQAVQVALESAGVHRARICVAMIDDEQIRRLNRQFLGEDEPTDVLSFPMGCSAEGLEGEIVVSGERAAAVASQYGWTAEQELLLYIIHGALHLAGFQDASGAQRRRMRRQEALCLRRLGLEPPSKSPTNRRTPPTARSKPSGCPKPNPGR